MKVKALAGIILYSPNPEQLAHFYKEIIGIPFELQRHGKITDHYECLFSGIHFAILKRKPGDGLNSVVPSFRVNDIRKFIDEHHLRALHPIIELGEGKCVTSISDVDGNMLRLIQLEEE